MKRQQRGEIDYSRPERLPLIDEDEPLQRRQLGPRGFSVGMVLALVAVVAIAAFGLGSAVAARQAPTPAPFATPTPPPTPSPAPTVTPTPTPPDIVPDAVSQRLRDIYYRSIRGGWAICVLGGEIACSPLANRVTDAGFDVTALRVSRAEWAGLKPTSVAGGSLVVVGFSNAEASNAFLIPLEREGAPAMRQILPVNPQLVGLYYYALGTLPPGEYGLSIGELVPVSNLAENPMYAWRARLVHFAVSAPRGPAASAAASPAP